jgi:hypothetical protein
MPDRHLSVRLLVSLTILLAGAPSVLAVDGVIEISQAGIDSAGGFPFVISQSGSYRLTSNLTVTVNDVKAIDVSVDNGRSVTIDLNGFTIRGTDSGSGQGISTIAASLIVRNGTVEDFGGTGISAGGQLVAEDLIVSSNVGRGISAGASTLRNVTVRDNGSDGALISSGLVTGSVFSSNAGFGLSIASGTGAVLGGYSNNVFILNTGGSVSGGVNLGGNQCGSNALCP